MTLRRRNSSLVFAVIVALAFGAAMAGGNGDFAAKTSPDDPDCDLEDGPMGGGGPQESGSDEPDDPPPGDCDEVVVHAVGSENWGCVYQPSVGGLPSYDELLDCFVDLFNTTTEGEFNAWVETDGPGDPGRIVFEREGPLHMEPIDAFCMREGVLELKTVAIELDGTGYHAKLLAVTGAGSIHGTGTVTITLDGNTVVDAMPIVGGLGAPPLNDRIANAIDQYQGPAGEDYSVVQFALYMRIDDSSIGGTGINSVSFTSDDGAIKTGEVALELFDLGDFTGCTPTVE